MPHVHARAKHILPLIGVSIFSLALWVLHRQLHEYHISAIIACWRSLPGRATAFALLLTLFNYLMMSGYDWAAFHAIKKSMAPVRIILASFISYAFTNNIGLSMIAGASVRYRLYSVWGLSAADITRIIGLAAFSIWIGFFVLAGGVFTLYPVSLPMILHLPFASTRLIGIFLLAAALGLLLTGAVRKQPFNIRGWRFSLPGPVFFIQQTAISAIDWMVAGIVLYMLLPPSSNLKLMEFIGLFLIAQSAGLISQVPGGLGVFETIMLVLLTPQLPAAAVAASLLAYRAIYYLFPLMIAVALLGIHEILYQRTMLGRLARFYSTSLATVMPLLLSFATFLGGAILLFSGALPAVSDRVEILKTMFPLPFVETSHFLGSITGMGLLLLARGLLRRMDAAYIFTVILLVIGILASIFKGLDYEEAAILSVILLAILPCRHHFYRKTSLMHLDFTPDWIGAILIVFAGSVWLGLFSHRHVEYSNQLWWHFAFSASAPRFLRAEVGAVGLVVLVAALRLLRPARPDFKLLKHADISEIAPLVAGSKRTYANLALLPDKYYLVNDRRSAFIMYAVAGRSWIAMGDPVGNFNDMAELAWDFRGLADRYGGFPVFYEVDLQNLSIYLDMGLALFKLGEEARVPLASFSLEGSPRKWLRRTKHQMERQGCRFEVVPPAELEPLLPVLQNISDDWLGSKKTREKGFSMGSFDLDYIRRFPAAVVRRNGRPVAFANLLRGAEKEELSPDLMRYRHDAPHGVMEYLFIELMMWGKAEGYRWFNLGMAPLTGLEDRALAPFWNRAGVVVARFGENFYNFEGLRRYKEKFDPVWTPRYIATVGGLALPRILLNLAALTSGGLAGVVRR